MTDSELKNTLETLLDAFHAKRLETLRAITFPKLLTHSEKIFYVVESHKVSTFVELSLQMMLADLEQAQFHNIFFEPIVSAAGGYDNSTVPHELSSPDAQSGTGQRHRSVSEANAKVTEA